jgi:hypothetical protein
LHPTSNAQRQLLFSAQRKIDKYADQSALSLDEQEVVAKKYEEIRKRF